MSHRVGKHLRVEIEACDAKARREVRRALHQQEGGGQPSWTDRLSAPSDELR